MTSGLRTGMFSTYGIYLAQSDDPIGRNSHVKSSSRELYYTGDDGSPLYMDLQPTPGGNISVGVYSDDLCSTPSSYTFGDYIVSTRRSRGGNGRKYERGSNSQ